MCQQVLASSPLTGHSLQRLLHQVFALRVKRTGGLVQEKDSSKKRWVGAWEWAAGCDEGVQRSVAVKLVKFGDI